MIIVRVPKRMTEHATNAAAPESAAQTPEQRKLAELIVEVLNLEDVEPGAIDPQAVMFDEEGLGLDSIDALEIAVAIAEEYGVQLSAEDEATRTIFATLANLCDYVTAEVAAR